MSYQVYFSFSSGLAKAMWVPLGTRVSIQDHIEMVESVLGLQAEQYGTNPKHWARSDFADISDDVLCETVSLHNRWVRKLWVDLGKWSKAPVAAGEELTPLNAQEFWHGLQLLTVPVQRWSKSYYTERMEVLFEVMRGREAEGITFNAKKALTSVQAGSVVELFSEFLDGDDIRLAAPYKRDFLASSYDGGYSWCDQCYRAIAEGDEPFCRRRKCPLKEELI
jgi:hypothetical protein